jgi:membrane-bound serine protease (ClpP class)
VKTRVLRGFFAVAATFGAVLTLASPASAAARPRVLAVHFDMDVNPVSQGYVTHQLKRAANEHYDAVVILLDTPGGLLESMRKI